MKRASGVCQNRTCGLVDSERGRNKVQGTDVINEGWKMTGARQEEGEHGMPPILEGALVRIQQKVGRIKCLPDSQRMTNALQRRLMKLSHTSRTCKHEFAPALLNCLLLLSILRPSRQFFSPLCPASPPCISDLLVPSSVAPASQSIALLRLYLGHTAGSSCRSPTCSRSPKRPGNVAS
jgi:hypothetical protein